MIWGWLVASALAGQIRLAYPEMLYMLDTRTLATSFVGQMPVGYVTGDIGYDSAASVFVIEAYGLGVPDCIMEYDPGFGVGVCLPVPFAGGVAHDSSGLLVLLARDAEYFPPHDLFVGLRNGIIGIDPSGNTWPIASLPAGFGAPWYALAWDADLSILWMVTLGAGVNWLGLEPTSFSPVVYGHIPDGAWGATGAYDDTPNQTPILFVSGTCPGDLTVTIADATPGEAVRVVSGARPGRTTVPTGPCRGTRADLANPQPRATLVADAFGLATTHVQATPAMCGRTLVQALDEGSCLVTDVVAVPAVP
jgi:hypothetical protein